MPEYTSNDKLKSGVHLGGLGTGTLQIFPDGTRGVFTGLNNWEHPLGQLHWFRPGSGSDYRVANPFAIYVKKGKKKTAKLLQTVPLANLPTVKKIEYKGEFPVAYLKFLDSGLPVDVALTAFSPFIKKDYKNSGLPVAVYVFTVSNCGKEQVDVSLLASAVNANSNWNVGRYNEVVVDKNLVRIDFRKKHADPRDEMAGIISLAIPPDGGEVTYFGEWSYAREPFSGNLEDRCFDAWPYFSQDGTLPNVNRKREAFGEMDEWIGALAKKISLKPREKKEIIFYYTWFMPGHYLGHAYQNWFSSSSDVARYVHARRMNLFRNTLKWQNEIKEMPFDGWLKDALINNVYVLTASSWWTKKGDFVVYENPVKWPLMDPVDVRYYGTIPLVIFFPELEKKTMELFAEAQRNDGRIPHDLGKSQINCPSDGTTAGHPWKDVSSKFVLMVYRDYLWTGDEKFLRKMYPVAKRAMEWMFSTDKNGDFLPDNEGKDSTYDVWDFLGTSSYTSSIFLAALLATEKMAARLKNSDFRIECRKWFKKGQESFERELWNGNYYNAASACDTGQKSSGKTTYNACILGQLNGQWYAHLLGLGYIVPREHIKKVVKTMLRLNARASRFGAVNSVFPDGRIDTSSYHSQNIWAGENYAFAALAIYEGFIKEGLGLSKRIWDVFARESLNPWSQPDVIFARDGGLGDGELYPRNMAIWAIPFALAKHNRNLAKKLTSF